TYVNGAPVVQAELKHGDIIHLATSEFRFSSGEEEEPAAPTGLATTLVLKDRTPPSVLLGRPLLERMLRYRVGRVVYQPIVELTSGRTVGYEALGRGDLPELSSRPADLFRLATSCALAGALSRMFRDIAAQMAALLPDGALLFCHVHAEELERARA